MDRSRDAPRLVGLQYLQCLATSDPSGSLHRTSETFFPCRLRLSESFSMATDRGLAACSRSVIRARIVFGSLPSLAVAREDSACLIDSTSACAIRWPPSPRDFSVVVIKAPAS